jgi:3D (Asp-Asp-Asp) domain-containing protein
MLGIALAVGILAGCGGEQQSLTVTATAYNSVPGQTQGDPNIGAWGDEIRPGDRVIAVSPDLLSLGLERGTKVRIEGLRGTYRVADRTHSRLERTIDIYMGTDVEKAREWGRQQVEIRWRN